MRARLVAFLSEQPRVPVPYAAKVQAPILIVPSKTVARIQEMHITLGQIFCGALERALGLA